MRFKYQTIPPECHCCGVMSHKGCDVDRFSDLDDDPKWGNWLCPRCRTAQQSGQTPLLAWSLYLAAFIAGIARWPDLQLALICMIFAALTQIIDGAFTWAQREADHIIAREEAKE